MTTATTTGRIHWLVLSALALLCLGIFLYPYLQEKLPMNPLPRNMKLKAFDPFRADFICIHEDTKVPPIDPEAQAWFEQSLVLTNQTWSDQDDYPAAVALLQKAIERKHWKAMINLASIYANGMGEDKFAVERDTERAVLLIEDAMRMGIPAAFDFMGVLHMEGRGVNGDASRGYAFAQLAADMGSPSAMAFLGKALRGTYSNPKEGFWANRKVAFKMLECGMAQGNGRAAFELGVVLDGADTENGENYGRSLIAFHNGTKFGNSDSANYLSVSFASGHPLVGNAKDPARARRYSALGNALGRNPDLRFPNLDKVLPLPPAQLPKWDGDPKTLIDAAKGVRPAPAQPKSPGSAYAPDHPAHVPPGYVLEAASSAHARGHDYQCNRPAAAHASGYWQPVLTDMYLGDAVAYVQRRLTALREIVASHPPIFVAEGSPLQLRDMRAMNGDSLYVNWQFLGLAVAATKRVDWLAQAGTVRAIASTTQTQRSGDKACPNSGIWQPAVTDKEHPLSKVLHTASFTDAWKWQAFVQTGQPMPSLKQSGMDIEDAKVSWQLMQQTAQGVNV